jgi:hypothetical protein
MTREELEKLRSKAAAVRNLAQQFKDEESRKLMIAIAEDYERAARNAERQAAATDETN